MKTETMRDGTVTYQQSEQMVSLAERWLLEYFEEFGPRRPGEMEDDFAGEPSLPEVLCNSGCRWRSTPFFPALARLIDKGFLVFERDVEGDVWYGVPGSLPPGKN